jgi:hypothetical protein
MKSRQSFPQYPDERVVMRVLLEADNGSRHLWTVISTFQPTDDQLERGIRASANHTFPAMGLKVLQAQRITGASVEL